MKDAGEIAVVLETSLGDIEIAVYSGQAPASARAFLALAAGGRFAHSAAFYRVVRKNGNDRGHPQIDVIQGGLQEPGDSLRGIEHEPTRLTGLRHLDGTVSLARDVIGTATGAVFFICIGDQPALDAGGRRNRDGQGFAAFGRVTTGMETVRTIHRLPTPGVANDPQMSGQILDPPVRILRAFLR